MLAPASDLYLNEVRSPLKFKYRCFLRLSPQRGVDMALEDQVIAIAERQGKLEAQINALTERQNRDDEKWRRLKSIRSWPWGKILLGLLIIALLAAVGYP